MYQILSVIVQIILIISILHMYTTYAAVFLILLQTTLFLFKERVSISSNYQILQLSKYCMLHRFLFKYLSFCIFPSQENIVHFP